MTLNARALQQFHIFIASPSDVQTERQHVRNFFKQYNRTTAHLWGVQFEVITWETNASIGRGRPQYLITEQTLEKYKTSLALMIGIMGQRFGSPSGKDDSGTEEEFNWAVESHTKTGFPEIKWFFRKSNKLDIPDDPDQADQAYEQWKKVRAFRKRMQDFNNPFFFAEYMNADNFNEVFDRDLELWLGDPSRPWCGQATEIKASVQDPGNEIIFDSERYRVALLKRFDALNFDMIDTTGANYVGVRLWNVFVPQSAREFHHYNPQLLEIPKELQRRLSDAVGGHESDLATSERNVERLRREYFSQPLRAILDVIDDGMQSVPSQLSLKLVVLGDPGSGKSSLIRFLAIRWANIADERLRVAQQIPLVIDLNRYSHWKCNGRKDFVRFLEEAPVWHAWESGLLDQLLRQPGRALLLLDGLDEIFDLNAREDTLNDVQRFCSEYPQTHVIVTSRVVGYRSKPLRDNGFRHFMLQDLNAAQIEDFVIRWHAQTFTDPEQAVAKKDRLQRAIKDSNSIMMLAGNPLLLTMMAILNRNQELPRNRVGLYEQASRLLLHHWDTERALEDFPGLRADISWQEKGDMLRRVAAKMQSSPDGLTGNMIDGATLTNILETYLRTELNAEQPRAAARAVVEHLRQRNFILCFVGADSYGFVHRTFLEYFCAADFVHQFNVAKTLNEKELLSLFDLHCDDDDWREVLRLICGQIDEAFVGSVVKYLITRTDYQNWKYDTPLSELSLAILCISEARNANKLTGTFRLLFDGVIRYVKAGHNRVNYEFFTEQLLPACGAFAARWPGLELSDDFAFEVERSIRGCGEYWWPEILTAIERKRSITLRFFASDKSESRSSACRALVSNWPDSVTRAMISEIATQDLEGDPRNTALKCLSETWPDEVTRSLLIARAIEDLECDPRSTALRCLAEEWPDETTRKLLTERATQDRESDTRCTAIEWLAKKWPDETTRTLLTRCAVQDRRGDVRGAAIRCLAEKWPDELTREFITQRAINDFTPYTRDTALVSLADNWLDDTTRLLLTDRSMKDQTTYTRVTALGALVENWPDNQTRLFLTDHAANDPLVYFRTSSLRSLARKWADETTKRILIEYAVNDDEADVRSAALGCLAREWPDDVSRTFLTERARADPAAGPRESALAALATGWTDEITRMLLIERAIEDPDAETRATTLRCLTDDWRDVATRTLLYECAHKDGDVEVRNTAIECLAEEWQDEASRKLLTQLAITELEPTIRSTALESLAKAWPDATSRAFITERATEDDEPHTRSTALRALSSQWADDTTRAFLTERATKDTCASTRGTAIELLAINWRDDTTRRLLTERVLLDRDDASDAALVNLAANWMDDTTLQLVKNRATSFGAAATVLGDIHSDLGGRIFTEECDGFAPYVDPRKPVPHDRIILSAMKAGIAVNQIDEVVNSLSQYLGWDILKGTATKAPSKRGRKKGRNEPGEKL